MTELLPQYKVVLVKEQEIEYNHKINSVQDAITLMMDLGFADTPEEHVHMFCTDARGKIIAMHEVSHGTLTTLWISRQLDPKEALPLSPATADELQPSAVFGYLHLRGINPLKKTAKISGFSLAEDMGLRIMYTT